MSVFVPFVWECVEYTYNTNLLLHPIDFLNSHPLVKSKHEAMLEHFSFSVKFIVDRGVSHEL